MALTPRQTEASYASQVFHASLIELGFTATLDALDEWADVQATPAQVAASVGRFLARVLVHVRTGRAQAQRMALAYVRYHRALSTGYTFGEGTSAPLSDLRSEFYSTVEEVTPDVLTDDLALVDRQGEVTDPPRFVSNERIKVETLEVPDTAELDDIAEEELANNVHNSAQRSLVNAQRESILARYRLAVDLDNYREKALTTAGSLAAGAAQRVVLNAGREVVDEIAKKDRRAIAYARLSGTGTPCGWCAMLISRGPIYRSSASAGGDDGRKYHDNCNCFAMPIYSIEQFNDDPQFDLNRELAGEWASVTKGLRGKSAIAAFRKFIRRKYATDAQAAA